MVNTASVSFFDCHKVTDDAEDDDELFMLEIELDDDLEVATELDDFEVVTELEDFEVATELEDLELATDELTEEVSPIIP